MTATPASLAAGAAGPTVEPHIVLRAAALIDSAANSCFISSTFAHKNRLPLTPLNKPRTLSLADSTSSKSRITHTTEVELKIGDIHAHKERLTAYVADLHYDVVLGRPWLSKHQPQTRWLSGTILLDSDHCKSTSAVFIIQSFVRSMVSYISGLVSYISGLVSYTSGLVSYISGLFVSHIS